MNDFQAYTIYLKSVLYVINLFNTMNGDVMIFQRYVIFLSESTLYTFFKKKECLNYQLK